MKLNFWQWLAVVLLVVGFAWWHYDTRKAAKMNAPPANPSTTPTTVP